jgi:hypothetical protein
VDGAEGEPDRFIEEVGRVHGAVWVT